MQEQESALCGKSARAVMEQAMLRNEIRERRQLGRRLSGILRNLAEGQSTRCTTILMDLSCCLDTSGPFKTNDLPMEPTGFVVTVIAQLANPFMQPRLMCELQVASMAVMYYRLAQRTGDAQDSRSCTRYCDWLEDYLKDRIAYTVVTLSGAMNWFLYPLKGTCEDKPHLPEWLKNGDTV